jgi:hypothetical protein
MARIFKIMAKILFDAYVKARERAAKTVQKSLGKPRNQRSLAEGKSKSGAEGEKLKLLKESGAIFSLRT